MEYKFSIEKIFKDLPAFESKSITELTVADKKFSSDKKQILRLASEIKKHCPNLFLSILLDPKIIDAELVRSLSEIYCSVEIDMEGSFSKGALLLEKKLYSSRARILNEAGIVWGFNMGFAEQEGDKFKIFRDRLDFSVSLYPNHIDFARFEEAYTAPKPTDIFSSKDIDFARGIAFACKTFYTAGRAVPWFNSVLGPLKIDASTFFADFEEWQQCNNCSFECCFDPDSVSHSEIERMQLEFLKVKYAEKNRIQLFPAVESIVRLNGAFSRVSESGKEESLGVSYHPDDLLSPYAMEIPSFCENVTMEDCNVRIFIKNGDIDYSVS